MGGGAADRSPDRDGGPFEGDGRTELEVPVDGREVTICYQARAGRHRVEVDGPPGRVALDAPPGVELGP
jgi:hypothetical protein